MWYQNVRIKLEKPMILERDGQAFTAETIVHVISSKSKKELIQKIEDLKKDGTFMETVDEMYRRL